MAKGCYAQKIPFPTYLRRKFIFYMWKFEVSTYESVFTGTINSAKKQSEWKQLNLWINLNSQGTVSILERHNADDDFLINHIFITINIHCSREEFDISELLHIHPNYLLTTIPLQVNKIYLFVIWVNWPLNWLCFLLGPFKKLMCSWNSCNLLGRCFRKRPLIMHYKNRVRSLKGQVTPK